MRTENTHRRPDLMLEDTTNNTILLIDMACPVESNKDTECMNMVHHKLCLRKAFGGPRFLNIYHNTLWNIW